jgi:Clostripain family
MSDRPSIDVERRRKADRPTGRAEAPIRRTTGGGEGGPIRPSGGGGFNIPSGGKLGGCGGIIVIILIIGYILLSGGGGTSPEEVAPIQEQPTQGSLIAENLPTNTLRPTRAPVAGQTGQKWLVMLYQDADDQILEQDIFVDLNETERVGSTDRVTIVAQLDRYRGAFQGDGDWTSARRYLVTQDDDLTFIGSQMVADLGEVNMADGSTLVDFVTWAMQTYAADRYVLVLSDHGMGWPGGWSDPAPGGSDSGSAPLVSGLKGDFLFLDEIDRALGEIRQQTGLDKFDIIGMDACLMSQLEVYAALQPHAHVALASEEVEPSLGWAYAGFLQELVDNPDMSSQQLAADIVNSYVDQDQRIVDDQARQDFLRQGSPMGGFFGVSDVGAAQLARQIERNATLTAVDLDTLPDFMAQFNQFVYLLQNEDQSVVATARDYAQSYTSVFGKQSVPSYIDLGHFLQLVSQEMGSDTVTQSARSVFEALNRFVVAEKHGSAKPGSTGVAIYFPNSTMYRSPYTGPQSYNLIAGRFVQTSLWDDFLAFHYSDRSFSSDAVEAVAPASGAPSRAPGAGNITLSNITASSDSITPGETVRLSADITGQNIGYVYLFIGLYDVETNSIYVADTDYLESPETRQVGGVYYPVWPQSESFSLNFNWDGSLFSVSDGTNSVLALFNPAAYGASAADAIYTLNGLYTFADSGEQKYAQLLFMDGKLTQVYGYQGQDDTGAPAEITPASGDTFTILQRWMDLDSSGNVTQVVEVPGDTLTFGPGATFTWLAVYAPPGDYLVGFLVADLDGNTSQTFTHLIMR